MVLCAPTHFSWFWSVIQNGSNRWYLAHSEWFQVFFFWFWVVSQGGSGWF